MDDFADSPAALVADVDCTAGGKSLCETHGVRGYPSIKYGEIGDLKDYQGGRSYDDFKKFAEENLGPTCGPGENIGLCDAATRESIEKYLTMSSDKLEGKIRNVVKMYEVESPLMKKALAFMKKDGGGKGEL